MSRFIAFDIEMPGQKDMRISAIGITVVEDGEIVDKRFYLVNPECRFDPYVIKLIGITPEMVNDKPTFPFVWKEIEEIMSSGILVAHGAAGDMKTLCECLRHYSIRWKDTAEFICTCDMGLACYPHLNGHGLDTLCEHIGFKLNHHNALSDSEGCARILLDFLNNGADIEKFKYTFDCVSCKKIRSDNSKKRKSVAEKIQKELFSLQSVSEKKLLSKKLKGYDSNKIIGVKKEQLFNLSRKLLRNGKYSEFLKTLPHKYFEENLLHAILISNVKKFGRVLFLTKRLLPHVDCLEICDYIRPGIFNNCQNELSVFVFDLLTSGDEKETYLGMNLAERYLFKSEYINQWLTLVSEIKTENFKIRKKRADFLSASLLKLEDETLSFLSENEIDKWTFNMALQKAAFSKGISPEKKEAFVSLRK